MINYTWNVSTVDTYPTLESNADVVKAAYGSPTNRIRRIKSWL